MAISKHDSERSSQEWLSGFIRLHILHHDAKEPLVGHWMIEELGQPLAKLRRTMGATARSYSAREGLFTFRRSVLARFRRCCLSSPFWFITI
jgi:PadR family transcriptional regulator PadR